MMQSMEHKWVDIKEAPGQHHSPGAWCKQCHVSVEASTPKLVELHKIEFGHCVGDMNLDQSPTIKVLRCSSCNLTTCRCKNLGPIKFSISHYSGIMNIRLFKWNKRFVYAKRKREEII